ncbi:MAG: hypothetical protein QJQ54_02455 [Mollicutes bacterium]|nr:MAG: hypothetical protein QJQ54_02455 [Mollicutes bacterium]
MPISAKKKHNIANLIQATKKNLSNIKKSSLKMQNSSLLEISKEIIREQILLQTNEEIPHQTALLLEEKKSTASGYVLF